MTHVTPADLDHLRPLATLISGVCAGDPAAVDTFDPYDFAALAVRETRVGHGAGYSPKGDPFGYGDRGHGFGFVQIDDRSHADVIAEVLALRRTDEAAALRHYFEHALGLLVESRIYLARRGMTRADMRRATFDAYNAGVGRVCRLTKGGRDPDTITAGGDYGSWTAACADELRIVAPALFAGGVA